MCANRRNVYRAHKYCLFSRCGVSEWCTELLNTMSVTLPKKPWTARSETKSRTNSAGLEALLGWRWKVQGTQPGLKPWGRVSSCCVELSPCWCVCDTAHALNHLCISSSSLPITPHWLALVTGVFGNVVWHLQAPRGCHSLVSFSLH